MIVKVLLFAYATGVCSLPGIARKLEEAVSVRGLGKFPEYCTLCDFWRRHVKVVETEQASRPDRPLVEVFTDSLDQEDDEEGCLICHP